MIIYLQSDNDNVTLNDMPEAHAASTHVIPTDELAAHSA
jgi:hypothetical protein